ncbi:hypothetical protein FD755_002004, partial [Muntiacus reevesi]
ATQADSGDSKVSHCSHCPQLRTAHANPRATADTTRKNIKSEEQIREDMRLPCSSNDKESACNAGDLSLIPGLGLFQRQLLEESGCGRTVREVIGWRGEQSPESASSAVMGLIETTRGLLPGAGGTQRLPRCLGVALAKELIFTGRRLSGAQAQALGLVNHAVAQNEEGNAAYHRARALAQEILPQAPLASHFSNRARGRSQNMYKIFKEQTKSLMDFKYKKLKTCYKSQI